MGEKMRENGIGYLKADALTKGKAAEIAARIKALQHAGAHKLILDLRDDSEGDSAEGVALAGPDEVVPAGDVIVSAGAYLSPALLLRSGIGPAADLAMVTGLARSMALRFGLVEKLGQVSFQDILPNSLGVPVPQQREYSEDTAREIDIAVRDIVHAAFERAVAILTREREVLERGAKLLLEKETLAEPELAELKSALKPA